MSNPTDSKYLPPTAEEMDALVQELLTTCSALTTDSPEATETTMAVIGSARDLALKWTSDIQAAMKNGIPVLVAAEVMAYGAMAQILADSPAALKELTDAGTVLGKFIVSRWKGNARQAQFRAAQGQPD